MSAVLQTQPKPAPGAHHNRDFVLQKYLLLEEQHESLRQHLDLLRPATMAASSQTTSPTQCRCSSSSSSSAYSYWGQRQPRRHSVSSSIASSTQSGSRGSAVPRHVPGGDVGDAPPRLGLDESVLDESTLHELAEEEAKLCGVNEGIKRALTELLNCEAVRADRALRTWVQCRLMETEKELRTGRRRRSAPAVEL